jgi:hypothetical protein
LRTGGLAAGFAAVLASLPNGSAVAQEPEGERPVPQEQEEQIAGAIQFIHPDKTLNYGHLPGFEVESVIDTGAALGRPAPLEYLNPDGVHPSLAGHTLIARAFVEHLAA